MFFCKNVHDNVAQTLIFVGIKKLAKAVAEVTINNFDGVTSCFGERVRQKFGDYNTSVSLAFLDSTTAAELIIRGCILEFEGRCCIESASCFSESNSEKVWRDLRKAELLHGYSLELSFPLLPEALKVATDYVIKKPDIYRHVVHLKTRLFTEEVSLEELIEFTLRFAFEVIEPIMIEHWGQIILLHLPEYNFEIDQHIETYLKHYEIEVSSHDSIG